MRITGLTAYEKYGKPVAHAFFIAPGNKFWEVSLFYVNCVATLVRRWGKFGSAQPGLALTFSNLFQAQKVFGRVTTEKRIQRWTQVGDSPVDQLAAITVLALPATPGLPTKYRHRPGELTCTCDAYDFPHRAHGGQCEGPEPDPDDDDGGWGGYDAYDHYYDR